MATEEQITEKLAEFREAVELKYKDDFAADATKYDRRDIERFRENDDYAKCFIRSFWEEKHGLRDAVDQVEVVFSFRKERRVNDLKMGTDFPADFEDKGNGDAESDKRFMYWHGTNNKDQKILLFKVKKHAKGKQSEEVKNFIAYTLDQHQQAAPGVRITLIFDFTHAGVTNMDMDIVKYIISCFTKHYPSLLSYILLYEMPFLLSSFWKIIQTWLSSEQKKKIVLVKKKDLPQYIENDQLEEHMQQKA